MPERYRSGTTRTWAALGVGLVALIAAPSALGGGEITKLSPNYAVKGAPQAVVTVTGKFPNTGVNPRVYIGSKRLPTQVTKKGPKNATELQATIPAGQLKNVGVRKLSVHDCKQGECTDPSPIKRFNVYGVNSISPAQTAAGEDFGINVDGRFPKGVRMAVGGWRSGTPTIHIDGVPVPTTVQSALSGGTPTGLLATVPGAAISRVGSAEVDVRLCHAGDCFVTLNSLPLILTAKGAVLASVNPERIVAGASQLVVGIRGSGFVPGASVRVDGTARPTSFVSDNFLSATLPAGDLAAAGTRQITVVSPNGGLSGALALQVISPDSVSGPVPVVTGADSSKGDAGAELTIGGTGFGAAQDASAGQVTFGGISVGEAGGWRSQRITVKVPDLPAGTYPVQLVANGIAATVGSYTINPTKKAPPIANVVLLPAGGGRVLLNAALSLDANSGTLVGDAVFRENAVGPSGIISVLWEYGDGTRSRGPTVSKTFTRPGIYPVKVTVTDAAGRSSTSRQVVRVGRSAGALRVTVPPANVSIPSRVVFDYGSAELRQESQQVLLKLADLVRTTGHRAIVGGHTDSVGSSAFNQRLSRDRARAVRRFLVTKGGLSPLLLTSVGYGETSPVATNSTTLGRQRNRRVSISILRSNSPVKLTGRQLQIAQRLAIAALLREKALRRRLLAGLRASDLKNGTLHAGSFDGSVVVAGQESLEKTTTSRPRPIEVPRLSKPRRGFRFTARQVLINRRISQVAVARANALAERFDDGLTGSDIADGAISSRKLVPGLRFGSIGAGPAQPRRPFSVPRLDSGSIRPTKVTEADLIANQRRSQAAIRRLSLLISRVNEGFSAEDFRPGSLSVPDIAR